MQWWETLGQGRESALIRCLNKLEPEFTLRLMLGSRVGSGIGARRKQVIRQGLLLILSDSFHSYAKLQVVTTTIHQYSRMLNERFPKLAFWQRVLVQPPSEVDGILSFYLEGSRDLFLHFRHYESVYEHLRYAKPLCERTRPFSSSSPFIVCVYIQDWTAPNASGQSKSLMVMVWV